MNRFYGQTLNSLQKSLDESKGLASEKVRINYSASNVLYLLDGVAVNPKEVTRYEVRSMEVFPSHSIEGVDTSRYKLVVKAESREKMQNPDEKIVIKGRVLNSFENQGIVGATITSAGGVTAKTDKQGYYQIHLPAGTKQTFLTFSHPEYASQKAKIDAAKTKAFHLSMVKENQRLIISSELPTGNTKNIAVDSSIYDVMVGKVFINVKGQDARITKDQEEARDIISSRDRTYYHIGDPEVLFTLDGVVTDPRTVKRSEVENASFENENVPDGYLIEFKAISKKAAEAARLKEKKTIVRGIIKDQKTGKPLPGTNIQVKGTENATISDLQGRYQIELPMGKGELLYSYVGYQSRTEIIQNSKILDIGMFQEVNEEADVITAKGRVVDAETGKPLPGTNILIKGTTTGTVSNREGEYSLQIPEGGEELLFVHIGYEEEVVAINGKEAVDVSLNPLSAEAKQKRIDELEKKRAERISKQLSALSSLDSTLIVVNGQARKEVKSFSELNIQPDEILAINVMGTESDMSQYLDAPERGQYNKVVRIITKKGRATPKREAAKEPGTIKWAGPTGNDSVLYIVDDLPIEPSELKNLDPNSIKSIDVKKDEMAAQFMTSTQRDKYNAVILITTKPSDPRNEESRIRGKVIDAESGEPIFGTKITNIHTKKVVASTDQKGKYAFVLENPNQKTFFEFETPGYKRYIMPACGNCFVSPTFPELLVLQFKKEDRYKEGTGSDVTVFPNPGNQEVKVRFNLQEAGHLEFQLLDKEGGFLKSITQDIVDTGEQEISIPVDKLPADTYFFRVKLNGKYETRRIILK